MSGRVEVQVERRPRRWEPCVPFRVLVLGDLSGKGDSSPAEPGGLAARRLFSVDADTLDDVLSRLSPRLSVSLPNAPNVDVTFRGLDDFHPDSLWARLPLFRDLAILRRRLKDPSTASDAMAEIRGKVRIAPPAPAQPSPPGNPSEADADTLERLLGKRPSRAAEAPRGTTSAVDLTGFFQSAVASRVVPSSDPHLPLYVQAVDEAIGGRMRALLHHPAVQELEALWRSVHALVIGLELGEGLQLHLLDATIGELADDLLTPGRALEDSALFRLLVERHGPGVPGGEPWAVLVGAFYFGPHQRDLQLLEALGTLAARAGGSLLAGATPAVLGCTCSLTCGKPREWQPLSLGVAKRWAELRRGRAARWIGLALPRVLLRLPYGSATDEVDGFAFEEFTSAREHEWYLWGNPAFVCVRLLAEAFVERGWAMEPGDFLEVGDCPAHAVAEEGETRLQPCAEVILPERAAEEILRRGPMPVLSYPNRNAVRLLRFQSLADPPTPLLGPWG